MAALDIGCGIDKVSGALGLDVAGSVGADVVCDLTRFPWPLADDSFDEIHARNVLEHLPDTVATMNEIHRVGRHGALVHIRTPHFAALESWEGPTHVKHFAYESFDYFARETRHVGHYSTRRFRVVRKKLHFGGHPLGLLARLLFWWLPRSYEKRWAFVFRPSSLEITLEVDKSGR